MPTVRRMVHDIDSEQVSTYEVIPAHRADQPYGVLIMHGAGTGNKELNLALARDFAAFGHHVVALDFSGHGDSSGTLAELSLRRRRAQAAAVIERLIPGGLPLLLVGFSMSGQTVADLVERYGDRVATIVLCAPAVYGRAAWDVAFGSGFTELIRRPESWRESDAPDAYAHFGGRAVLVLPGNDAVIPAGVTELLVRALSTNADFSQLRIADGGHQLGRWLADHPEAREAVVEAALRRSPVARAPERNL
jgi:pimeloyl-ACP methyl ester carboxylesterase